VDLYREIELLVEQIPDGMFSTYKAVAIALGDEIAESAVKQFLDGRENRNVFSFIKDSSCFFNKFKTTFPLKKLREEQLELSRKVITDDDFGEIESVAGMDVAYAGDTAYGAYVEMDTECRIIKRKTVKMKVDFPYIPTYFSYREMPVLNELFKKEKPSVVMVDGNGILHPRQFGMATHFGFLNSVPSIGIAKKLLCGKIDGNYIYIKGKKVGFMHGKEKPIYISVGHKISLESSLALIKKFCRYRIPEPLRQAHMLARTARNENNL